MLLQKELMSTMSFGFHTLCILHAQDLQDLTTTGQCV